MLSFSESQAYHIHYFEECFVEKDTYYCGYDIEDPDTNVYSEDLCRTKCQNNDKCQFWTYGKWNVNDDVTHCHLKSSDLGRESYPGLASGTKYCRKLNLNLSKC